MSPAPYLCEHAFFFPVRVYYEDTDAAGVVYHSNYLAYAERARTEWLRHMGFEQAQMLAAQNTGFAVARLEIAYKKPARLDDLLWVETRLRTLGKVRMSMRQIIRAGDTLCAELSVEIACINQAFAPQKIGGSLRDALERMVAQK